MIRVFISFAMSDAALAKALHAALTKRGVSVFQFQETARAGKNVWNQVYDNIESADFFICLLSRDAIKSIPVNKEVDYADWCHTNGGERPDLVPVLLEDIAPTKWPQALRPISIVDLTHVRAETRDAEAAALVVERLGIAAGVDDVATNEPVHAPTPEPKPEPEPEPATLPEAATPTGPVDASDTKLWLTVRGTPDGATEPAQVDWQLHVENKGRDSPLLYLTLDGRELRAPFALAAGEGRSFSKKSRYTAPGAKSRVLRAFAEFEGEMVLLAEREGWVSVAEGAAAQSATAARAHIEARYSSWNWQPLVYGLMVLVLGALASYGAYLGALAMLGDFAAALLKLPLQTQSDFYDAPINTLIWVGENRWFQWSSGGLVAYYAIASAWNMADTQLPMDMGEYVWVTAGTLLLTVLISGVWAAMHVMGIPVETLAALVAGAVGLSTGTIVAYAVIDAF